MPIKSRWTLPIPEVTLPTYLFGSPDAQLSHQPLIIDARTPEKHFLTQHTYRLWAQRFAAGLQAHGLQDGDRVLLFSGNSIFFPVVIVGTIMAGGIFSGANPTYTPRELAYQLKDTGARFLICAEGSIETGLQAAFMNDFPLNRVFTFDDGPATCEGRGMSGQIVRHWTHLVAPEYVGSTFRWEELSPEKLRTRTVTLNYSSGTTGVPKGVEITHRCYISNAAAMILQAQLDPKYEERLAKSKSLCFLPLYHAMAQTIFGINAPKQLSPVYMMPKFDFVQMLENIQRFKVTFLVAVPPILVAIAKSPLTKNYDLSSIEKIGSGAAPLGREICAELEKLWPPGVMNVKQGWGMTEITCSALGWDPEEHSESFSVGELNANCEAMLVDDDGNELIGPNKRGEIWVRGPNVMKGYWNRPDATAETLTSDGWLKTGDIAFVDERNRFYIVDRRKELIKVKGNQVAPAELEALMLNHDAIADVAVIGVETPDKDEQPRAYVVLKQGVSASEKEIFDYVAKQVTAHKRLTGGIRFTDVIPKNPSGKILRKLLRDQAKAEAAESAPIRARL